MHFSSYINNTHNFEYLSAEREKELAIASQKGDVDARQKLISSHLRLVFRIAKQFSYKNSDLFEDLVQEGNLGLIYAVDNFDPSKNCRLFPYAKLWVTEFVKRKTYKNLYMLSAPFRVIQKSFQINKDPFSELEEEKKEGENLSIQNIVKEPYYLDATINSESQSTLGDLIEDPNPHFTKIYEDGNSLEHIREAIKKNLSLKEQTVIQSRYLKGEKKSSYKEIAQTMNLSSETIRNIEKEALLKLRNYMGNS